MNIFVIFEEIKFIFQDNKTSAKFQWYISDNED